MSEEKFQRNNVAQRIFQRTYGLAPPMMKKKVQSLCFVKRQVDDIKLEEEFVEALLDLDMIDYNS